MAYLIFNLNDFSGIHQMAENNSILNQNKNFHNEHRSIIEIDNTDYLFELYQQRQVQVLQ